MIFLVVFLLTRRTNDLLTDTSIDLVVQTAVDLLALVHVLEPALLLDEVDICHEFQTLIDHKGQFHDLELFELQTGLQKALTAFLGNQKHIEFVFLPRLAFALLGSGILRPDVLGPDVLLVGLRGLGLDEIPQLAVLEA